MPEWWERQYGGDAGLQAAADGDDDGIPNIIEFQEGLDPTVPDDIDYLILQSGWNLVAVPGAGGQQTFGGFFGSKTVGSIWSWDGYGEAVVAPVRVDDFRPPFLSYRKIRWLSLP